jgi:preprotein translocase subunit SecE
MAKQTRAQRRARRAEQERQGNGTDARPVQRQTTTRVARTEPAAAPPGERRGFPGSGFRRFVGESAAELKKVEWPGQQQLIQGTAVVLIACVIVGTYLWVADLAFKRLVQHVFLGQ